MMAFGKKGLQVYEAGWCLRCSRFTQYYQTMNKDQLKKFEADLWRAADSLRANSDLKASEYSTPVLGLIFLKFADNKYRQFEAAILAEYQKLQGSRREKKLSDIAIEQ